MCGILLPLSVRAYDDWIYTWVDEYWNEVKTVIFWWNDTFSGVQLTIKMTDQTWNYYWWFNKNTDNSVWDDYSNPWTWTYMSGDGKMHWGTWWVDNVRWWSGDTAENWYTPRPTNFYERQWPCETWYHVPSRWERNTLALARCILVDDCAPDINIRISNIESSKWLIEIRNQQGIWSLFKSFLMSDSRYFRSSSPVVGMYSNAWDIYVHENIIYIDSYNRRSRDSVHVRCFKNEYLAPAPLTFTITFLDESKYIRSGEIESWSKISIDVISWYNLTWLTKEWYTFSWWAISGSDEMFNVETDVVTTWITLNAVREAKEYTITFDTDWWSKIESITADYWTWISVPANPTKNGYKFIKREPEFPSTMPLNWLTVKAIWEKLWSSGGWGGRSSKTSDTQDSSTPSQNDNKSSSWTEVKDLRWDTKDSSDKSSEWQNQQQFTQEFQEAYEFAHENGITTKNTIQSADMNWKLTRIAMAKMLSQYAINVLWKTPDTTQNNKFNDVTDKRDADYDDWVTLAYQLWIMWQNMPWNNFRPNDEVTRAEFATALSRMLYNTSDGQYKSTDKYYTNHMSKLVKEWIITKDDPKMKELRGYVMIMLMRSAK